MPPHVLMNFRGFPPGCGDSVADFWGWDAHEARLRCPDYVSGDMQEDEIPRESFPARKNSHGRTGNRTRDLMISSQRPWPLDHEAGHILNVKKENIKMDVIYRILSNLIRTRI